MLQAGDKLMDVNYINPFLRAIQNVFETMIDVPFTLGKPTLKRDDIPSYEVSGVIGITGEVVGCVVVSFPESVALQLASALLQDKLTKVDQDCTDAIGEIANIVAGDAKKGFPKGNTSISVPSVIIGQHRIAFPKGVPIISIPCGTKAGNFSIDVALKIQ
jgi:chemotaxis protein CheX